MNAEMNNEREFVETSMDNVTNLFSTPEEETVTQAKEGKNFDMAIGVGIGTAIGAVVGTGVWWIERNKRMQLLKAVENAIIVTDHVVRGKDKVTIKKEEIDLAGKVADSPLFVLAEIKTNLDKVKIGKKEKAQWNKVYESLLELVKERTMDVYVKDQKNGNGIWNEKEDVDIIEDEK